jgi:hypothetical protein
MGFLSAQVKGLMMLVMLSPALTITFVVLGWICLHVPALAGAGYFVMAVPTGALWLSVGALVLFQTALREHVDSDRLPALMIGAAVAGVLLGVWVARTLGA